MVKPDKKNKTLCLPLGVTIPSLLLILLLPLYASPSHSAKRILIINSYHQGFSFSDQEVEGVRSALPPGTEVHVEYMDAKRMSGDPKSLRMLYDLYRHKYRLVRFDAVVSLDDDAFQFLLRHHAGLFPDVPVVFMGVNRFEERMLAGKKDFTGVVETIDIEDSIRVALKLHPYAKKVYAVTDNTTTGRINREMLEKLNADKVFPVPMEFLDKGGGLSLDELLDRLRSLPQDSIVYYADFFQDRTGRVLAPEDVMKAASGVSTVPIYVHGSMYLGSGATGGKLNAGYYHGRQGGAMVRRILGGEPVSAVPVERKSENQYMFDDRQLQRFQINEKDLPGKSVILFRKQTAYEQYRTYIIIVIVVILLLSSVIIALMVNIARRRRIEKDLTASEERYRSIFENAVEGIYQSTPEGRFISVNPAMARMCGYASPEEMKSAIADIAAQYYVDPGDREKYRSLLTAGGHADNIEYRVRRKDGSVIWVSSSAREVRDDQGHLAYYEGIVQDITEHRKAEEALRERESLIRSIFEADPTGVALTVSRVFKRANRRFCEITGYSVEELIGRNALLLYDDEAEYNRVGESLYRELKAKGIGTIESRWKRKDGSMIDVLLTVSPLNPAEWSAGLTTVALDISDRKKAEEALRKSESNLQSIFRVAPIGIGLVSNRIIMRVNDRLCEMVGCTRDELVGKSARTLYLTDDEFNYVGKYKYEQISQKGTGTVETKWVRKNGDVIDILLSSTPIEPDNLEAGVTFTALDITERKRAEQQVLESMEKYRLLADNSTDIIWTMNLEGRFTYVSPSVRDITGFTPEEVMTIPLDKYIVEDDLPWVMESLYSEINKPRGERTERRLVEVRQYKKDGSVLDIEVATAWLYNNEGETIGLQGSTRDISSRKRMEEESAKLEKQLLQAQKMEAIGTLAGGIAHDFNNILTTIQGYVSLMQQDLRSDHPHYTKLGKIEEQINSGANLTRQLLGFAKGGKYEIKAVSPNELLDKSADVFGRTKKEVAITKRLQEDIWMMEVDPVQIEQTLFNMFINAWQAMPGGGELYLQSRNISLNDMDVMPHGVKPGRYVVISVTDTGTGMDEETRKRIFEPFFTTKEHGKGTGLGLASAYGIVKNHQGFITVYSEQGKGTTFNIYLPASDRQQAAEEKPVAPAGGTGRETILLVDDEADILSVTKELLENRGYTVLTAGSGQEAIAVFMEKKGSIDLVILDMIMPGIGGGKAFDSLLEIDPEVKILLASGYSINGEAQQIMDKGCRGFIQKPFRISELSGKIREVL